MGYARAATFHGVSGDSFQRISLFLVFTLRRRGDDILIRPISARYMHDKEVKNYEKENPNL